jgi:hypothetical protein
MARCARPECGRWRPDLLLRMAGGLRTEDGWYCSRPCLKATVEDRLEQLVRTGISNTGWVPRVRLGSLLVAGEARLSPALLSQALEAQRTSGRRLGAELLQMGAITAPILLRALAKQANTRYLSSIDPAIAQPGHGGLSSEMVRALGLVPFAADPDTRVLKVAYVAPLPRVALAALRELTDWTTDPYLVSDETFAQLVEAYGARTADQRSVTTATAPSLEDGLARIAQLAERGHPAKISQARLDTHVWVRVEATGHVDDVLVAVPEFEEDATWQTAPTLH